jgi:hypothetical protein
MFSRAYTYPHALYLVAGAKLSISKLVLSGQ